VAIQSPSFQQEDWIAALPAVARNDEAARLVRHFIKPCYKSLESNRDSILESIPDSIPESRVES